MSVYAKYFKSVNEALNANDLVSPNATFIAENDKSKYLMIDCGKDKKIEIVGTTIDDLTIQQKQCPADNEIWYKTANNNEKIYDFNAAIEWGKESFSVEYTGPTLVSNTLDGEWYKAKFSSNLTAIGVYFNAQTEEIIFNGIPFVSHALNDDYDGFIKEIKLPNCITSLNAYSFFENNLVNVNMPKNLLSITMYAFTNVSSLTSINIPANLNYIDTDTFGYSLESLESIAVDPANNYFTTVNGTLFNYDKTTLIQYPGSNAQTIYNIPEGTLTINNYAFNYAKNLTSITIPNGVTTIGEHAFEIYKMKFNSIVLPATITRIDKDAFAVSHTDSDEGFIQGIDNFTILATTPPVCCEYGIFINRRQHGGSAGRDTSPAHIYVPVQAVNTYKNADYWKNFASKIEAIPE